MTKVLRLRPVIPSRVLPKHHTIQEMVRSHPDDIRCQFLIRADIARRDMTDWRNQSYSKAFHRHWTAVHGLHLEYDDVCDREEHLEIETREVWSREAHVWATVWLALMWVMTIRKYPK